MAGVPGKNKIETGFRILVDDSGGVARDLSADLVPGSIQGGGATLDEVDMTGVSNTIKNALSGHGASPVTARFYMNDTATTGAFTVLNGRSGTSGTLTLQFGSAGAAPSTGDPEWEGEYTLLGAPVTVDAGRFVLSVTFVPTAGQSAPAWGTVA